MHRGFVIGAIVAAMFLGASSVRAEDSADAKRLDASPRHHEWATIKAGDREVRAYVVFPEVNKPVPAVIVIHENKGLTDWVRSVADQVAEAGYVAVAPDLLSGTGPDNGATESFESEDAARDAIYKLPPEQVTSDLRAVEAYARGLDATTDTVTAVGFCWGGGQAFRYAANGDQLAAAFVFYGTAPGDEELAEIKAPVYGFYGENDFRITGQVPTVEKKLAELNKTFEPVIYEAAGHGFMRSGEMEPKDGDNHKARDEAWKRWKELLEKHAK